MKPPRQTRPSRFPGLWRATCGGGALMHVHYDETLRTAGPVNHYEIVN